MKRFIVAWSVSSAPSAALFLSWNMGASTLPASWCRAIHGAARSSSSLTLGSGLAAGAAVLGLLRVVRRAVLAAAEDGAADAAAPVAALFFGGPRPIAGGAGPAPEQPFSLPRGLPAEWQS